jgi:hypothetical protein
VYLRLAALLRRLTPGTVQALGAIRLGEQVTVRGRVVPRDLLTSPHAGARCVYYRYVLDTWRRSALGVLGGDGFWERSEDDEAIAEFYLDDGHDRVLVSPIDAAVVAGRGMTPATVDVGDGRRASELTIGPGDRLEIAATVEGAIDLHDEGRDYRSDARRVALAAPRIRLLSR